jgi:hypothetical protein
MKVHVHWINLMKNQIIQKFQSFEILKEKATRQKIHFLNHLTKNIYSMNSKCLASSAGPSKLPKKCLVVH